MTARIEYAKKRGVPDEAWGEPEVWRNVRYGLNSLKGGYIGDYIGDYHRGY